MQRRTFVTLLGGAIMLPSWLHAQQSGRQRHRVGLIVTTSPVSELEGPNPPHPGVRAFVHALRDLGHEEGERFALERRSAEGRFDRFGEIAHELIRGRANVIVTVGNDLTRAVRAATAEVPIVMATSNDPAGAGLVSSLARPGGNVTGLTVHAGPEFEGKRMELLQEVVPSTRLVAFLGVGDEWDGPVGEAARSAAQKLGITLLHAEHRPTDYAEAFALIARSRPVSLFVTRHVTNYANRQTILNFSHEHRLPAMYPFREFAERGGLISYGVSIPDLFRRAAGYVDKILKGAKPADLPVEQPTKFELVINLKTAKALGITVPPSLLARADEVIE